MIKLGRRRQRWIDYALSLLVLAIGFLVFMPFLFMLSSSMRTPGEAYQMPPALFPTELNLENYATLLHSNLPFKEMYINSFVVTVAVIIVRVFVCVLAAYSISKIRFKGSNAIFISFLSSMMLPAQAITIPLYIVLSRLNLVNTLTSLVMIGAFDSFGIFLYRQSMMGVPDEIVESAKIDGAKHLRICWQIVVPMIKSTIATLVVLSFNGVWNDYYTPFVFISKWEKMTLPLGIAALKGYMGGGNQSVILAGISIGVLPILVVFLLGQRFIVDGLTASAVKG